ncbi:MAG: hypothetical protein HKN42_18225, partial [Granulosicoccus sp.]|nr:hypothetical protein [Granulosicoccus sp.]
EYVLGTLRGAEREVFEKILQADDEVRQKVLAWQRRLEPLDSLTTPIEPPAYILPALLARLHEQGTRPALREPEQQDSTIDNRAVRRRDHGPVPHPRRKSSSRRGNRLWKAVAGLAIAASVAMAALLLQLLDRSALPPAVPAVNSVSIVQNEQRDSLWVLTTRADSNALDVVALAPPAIDADRSYELWMVKPDDAGVNSVGLLPLTAGESTTLTLPISTEEAQLFAVSLEPLGGSPEAVPTGPVLFTGSIITLSRNSL